MTSDTEKRQRFKGKIGENIDFLYGLARRLAKNEADAEDLVADAVTKAWIAFDTLDNKNSFRSWIARILHNVFYSGYRKKKARPTEVSYCENDSADDGDEIYSILENMPDEFLLWWGNPEKEYANKLLGEEITKAIDLLPEQFRMVIVLINVDGFSYQETAEILDIPSGTVRSRMKRGRTLLQKSLWDMANEFGIGLSGKTKVKTNE